MKPKNVWLPLACVLALALVLGVLQFLQKPPAAPSGTARGTDPDAAPPQADSGPPPAGDGVSEHPGPLPGAVPPRHEAMAEAMQTLARRMRQDGEGLQIITHPDGRRSVDLEGRFMHMSAAVPGADGKTEIRCFADFREMTAASAAIPQPSPSPPSHHVR